LFIHGHASIGGESYPTLCELCKLPTPTGLEGHSVAPLLKDPKAKWEHPVYSVAGASKATGRAVRTERYRYVEYDGMNGGVMLFDHQNDPYETKNLAEDPQHSQTRAELAKLLKKLPGTPSP
jgi:arylsulfatase A-like enzyme